MKGIFARLLLPLGIATCLVLLPRLAPAMDEQGGAERPRPDIEGAIAAVDALVASDKGRVGEGHGPAIVLQYDERLEALVHQASAVWDTHDPQKRDAWAKDLNAATKARSDAWAQYNIASAEHYNKMAELFGNLRQPTQGQPAGQVTSRGTHICGSGPGPGEVQIGEIPAGNGVAAVPLCQ